MEASAIAINNFGALQKMAEFATLLHVLSEGEPKVIVEIGVGNGGSTWAFSKLAGLKKLIAIDLPSGPWGGSSKEETEKRFAQVAENTSAQFTYIAGNSQNSTCLSELENVLDGDEIDFLFIDGDHSYDGVKSDFLIYKHLVAPGGLIGFHDSCEHPKETGCEVKKFVDEIKDTCPVESYSEFICEPTNWGGIFVIKV